MMIGNQRPFVEGGTPCQILDGSFGLARDLLLSVPPSGIRQSWRIVGYSGNSPQAAVQVVFVKARNLDQFDWVQDGNTAALYRHRSRQP